MINIDVLLQAAEYIERQQSNLNQQQNFVNDSSLLSPSSSSSSSSSSSASSSSSNSTSPASLNQINENVYHKKFNKRSNNAQQQGNELSLSFKNEPNEANSSPALKLSSQNSPITNSKAANRSSPVNASLAFSPNVLNTNSPNNSSKNADLAQSNLNFSPSIPFPSPSLSSTSTSSTYSFSLNENANKFKSNSSSATSPSFKSSQNANSSSSSGGFNRLDDIKRDKAIHNTLEKNRRAHLKECFENLQNELHQYKDKKVTNLLILNYTLKIIEQTKKKDRENELEKKRLLKRQQLLRQTLNNLIQDFEAESFDYKSWLSANQASTSANNEPSELISRINQIEEEEMKMEFNEDDGCESASTSTASEANDYMKSSKSKSKRSSQHMKMQPYQRKRCSNSLCIVSPTIINLSKVPKPNTAKQQEQHQQKMLHMQHKLEMQQQQQKQRHHSVDENMINRRRKNNSLSINLDDDNGTIDDYLYEDDDDDESNYENYEDDDESELIINEDDDNESSSVSPKAKSNKSSGNQQHAGNGSKKSSHMLTTDESTDSASSNMDINVHSSHSSDGFNNSTSSSTSSKHKRSRNSSLSFAPNAESGSANLVSSAVGNQVSSSNPSSSVNQLHSFNSNGTTKYVVIRNPPDQSNPSPMTTTNPSKSILSLNQLQQPAQYIISSNNHQTTLTTSGQTASLVARDLINKTFQLDKNVSKDQTSYLNKVSLNNNNNNTTKPFEQLFQSGIGASNLNIPTNLINLPFFKSVSIPTSANNTSPTTVPSEQNGNNSLEQQSNTSVATLNVLNSCNENVIINLHGTLTDAQNKSQSSAATAIDDDASNGDANENSFSVNQQSTQEQQQQQQQLNSENGPIISDLEFKNYLNYASSIKRARSSRPYTVNQLLSTTSTNSNNSYPFSNVSTSFKISSVPPTIVKLNSSSLQTYLNNHNENNNNNNNTQKINQQVGNNKTSIDDAINELNKASNIPFSNQIHMLTKKSP